MTKPIAALGSLRIPLRHLREERGLTQVELSERTGIQQGSLSKIEQGPSRIGLDTLVRLAHGLGLASPLELFQWEPAARFGKHRHP